MHVDQFNYELPEGLIAQFPLENRTDSRLLVVDPFCREHQNKNFSDISALLNSGDLLVVNDTRVLPARINASKPTGGKVEIMLERIIDSRSALVMLRANKPIKTGQELRVDHHRLEVVGRDGVFFKLTTRDGTDAAELFQAFGKVPLPPYIERSAEEEDADRYQTVYSRNPGAVAAPTAGLHFDEKLISELSNKGISVCSITLHVGAGTFQPVKVSETDDHKMHHERMEVSQSVCDKIRATKTQGGRVIAVGTTVVRALESAALTAELVPTSSDTNLFITPGFSFNVIDCLVTNFHLPKSTLLMMVCAFSGYNTIFSAYRHAITNGYRFFSYGDAMFLERKDGI